MNEAASFLEHNLTLIRSRYPGLAEQLGFAENSAVAETATGNGDQDGTNNAADAEAWHIEQSAAGYPTLRYNGVFVHSGRDPAREGKRQAEAALAGIAGEPSAGNSSETGRSVSVFLLGFGLGYTACALAELMELAAQTSGAGSVLVIVERRKELFRLALETRNLETLLAPGKTVFVIGESAGASGAETSSGAACVTGALALLEKAGKTGKPLVIKNRALADLTPEDKSFYDEAERRIHTWASKDQINAATLKRFGKRWTKNLGANLSGIYRFPGVNHLEGLLRNSNVPVFLAAAGPSLNDIEPYLKEIHRRCLVLAVDTSFRFLSGLSITPDFVVSVDPQYWNARHLHRVKSPATALVAESAVYPPVLRGAFSRIFFCQSLFPLGRFIEDRTGPKGPLGAGGSVATTAWDFARLLGPKEIWIAGLDLAFPGYRTHYRGALFEENAHAASSRLCPAETFSVHSLESGIPFTAPATGGGKVLSDRRLSLYAAWFENRFGQNAGTVRSYGLRVPGRAGGLLIPGLENAEAEQLLALPPRRDEINTLVEGVYRQLDREFYPAETERKNHYDKALGELVRGLKEIRDNAEDAAVAAKRGLAHLPTGTTVPAGSEVDRLIQKLDRINKIIGESPVKEAAGFLFPPVAELEKECETVAAASETTGTATAAAPSAPLRRYLDFSFRFYRSLAEAALFTLDTLPS